VPASSTQMPSMHRHQRRYAVLSLATTYRTSNTLRSSTLHSSGTVAAGHGTESSTLGKMQSKEISMSTTTKYAQPITNNNNTMKDYILVRKGIPVEQDVIYAAESVVDLFNDGFYLEDDEQFIEYKPNNQQ